MKRNYLKATAVKKAPHLHAPPKMRRFTVMVDPSNVVAVNGDTILIECGVLRILRGSDIVAMFNHWTYWLDVASAKKE